MIRLKVSYDIWVGRRVVTLLIGWLNFVGFFVVCWVKLYRFAAISTFFEWFRCEGGISSKLFRFTETSWCERYCLRLLSFNINSTSYVFSNSHHKTTVTLEPTSNVNSPQCLASCCLAILCILHHSQTRLGPCATRTLLNLCPRTVHAAPSRLNTRLTISNRLHPVQLPIKGLLQIRRMRWSCRFAEGLVLWISHSDLGNYSRQTTSRCRVKWSLLGNVRA